MITTLSEFDRMVCGLTAQGVPRLKAEKTVREILERDGLLEPRPDPAAGADEDAVVAEGDRLMRALGFVVVRFSQKKRAKVTAGIPDRRYYHTTRRLVAWWEAKATTGRQRPEQRAYQQLCDAVDDPYILGGLAELRAWLVARRVATFDPAGLPTPLPQEQLACVRPAP